MRFLELWELKLGLRLAGANLRLHTSTKFTNEMSKKHDMPVCHYMLWMLLLVHSFFDNVRNLYQGSISPCSATWALKTRSRTEEQLSNAFAADVFYFSIKAIAQVFLDSGTCALQTHLPWMKYLRTAVSLEASIQDPPSDTFWWIEGCATCSLFGVSVLLWNGKRPVASKSLLALSCSIDAL